MAAAVTSGAEAGVAPHPATAAAVVLLCGAAGAADVLSFLTLGQVFTSAMTGCMALFLIALIGGRAPAALRAGLALVSYMAGVAGATVLQGRDPGRAVAASTLRRLLCVEVAALGLYCVLAALAPQPPGGVPREALIFLSAAAMGVQSVVARDIGVPGIMTVVVTTTLTMLTVALTRRVALRTETHLPRQNRLQLGVLAGYAAGAAGAAAILAAHAGLADLLPLAAALGALGLCRDRRRRTAG